MLIELFITKLELIKRGSGYVLELHFNRSLINISGDIANVYLPFGHGCMSDYHRNPIKLML